MPTNARVQVTLRARNGIPADNVTNTLHFEGDSPTLSEQGGTFPDHAPGLANRVEAFYQTISPLLGIGIGETAELRLYNMTDPLPRVPFIQREFTITPASTGLPNEVAVCLSYRGARVSGASGARSRGRIFIGPLALSWNTLGPGGVMRPNLANRDALINAAQAMAVGSAQGAFRLAVFSPRTAAGGDIQQDAAWNDVTNLWVDDAFDTQRRRGPRAGSRVVRTVG